MTDDPSSARIAEKLAEVASAPDRFPSFGAEKHGYRLKPPLPESTVAAFEAEHDIVLPDTYRRFITELGDGGAGPSYGLLTLADAYAEVSDSFPGHLVEPSPFVPGMHYAQDWWDRFWGPDDRPDPLQGTLAIVHHGCTSYTQLVVSGPGRGRLVNVDLNGVPAPYVLEDNDFLSWYERWLDELLAGYDVTWFGEKIPGDAPKLLDVLADDPSPQRRARAARSLSALPAISPTAADALARAATDLDPLVREAVMNVARHSKVAAVEPAARAALSDPEAPVRAGAISVLRALGATDVPDKARQLLTDPDREVRWQAMQALADSNRMVVADLAPLITGQDAKTRESATYFLIGAQGKADDLLAQALADNDPAVRRQAVQTAEQRDERTLLPDMERMLETETDGYVRTNLDRVVTAWSADRPHHPG
ncbi:HEAT repeat domain-containing protein [Actinomadura sp. NAK00032]|uniref:SMI1/KNR4 family protein n=1 Tax=Actinomadura sp. NAK00032 TaxID=2742128 RepID=UPI0015913A9A|nr:SMI1/KNR4 family protein [Actinomadura sp. NAK00032]QKW32840.1 HEAT repeat domain-containing protein [Actinomadura sp. NAK00032]